MRGGTSAFIAMGCPRYTEGWVIMWWAWAVQAPCILFIDEFDGLGKQRSATAGGDDESVHTINQLLTGAASACRHASDC